MVNVSRPSRHVVFVCWSNICRSPMAERVAQHKACARGLNGWQFTSAAVAQDGVGQGIEARAQRALRRAGYQADGHRAHQITAREIHDADLVVGMQTIHLDMMQKLAPDATNLVLITDFDPSAPNGTGIDDPWYGPEDEFTDALVKIERAVDGLLATLDEPATEVTQSA